MATGDRAMDTLGGHLMNAAGEILMIECDLCETFCIETISLIITSVANCTCVLDLGGGVWASVSTSINGTYDLVHVSGCRWTFNLPVNITLWDNAGCTIANSTSPLAIILDRLAGDWVLSISDGSRYEVFRASTTASAGTTPVSFSNAYSTCADGSFGNFSMGTGGTIAAHLTYG